MRKSFNTVNDENNQQYIKLYYHHPQADESIQVLKENFSLIENYAKHTVHSILLNAIENAVPMPETLPIKYENYDVMSFDVFLNETVPLVFLAEKIVEEIFFTFIIKDILFFTLKNDNTFVNKYYGYILKAPF